MTRLFRHASAAAVAALLTLAAAGAASAAIVDPTGDFLPTYTGPQNADLDLTGASALRDGGGVTLTAALNGTFGTTPGAFLAWGVNRGAGTTGSLGAGSPSIGAGILHDAVVLVRPNLTGTVVLVGPGGVLTFLALPANRISFSGGIVEARVGFDQLAANGVGSDGYRYSVWTRSGQGSNALVADFAPNASTFAAAVPEPATWAMMIGAFAAVGGALRRRSSLRPA